MTETGSEHDRRVFLQQVAGGVAAWMLVPEASAFGPPVRTDAPLNVGLVGAGRWGRQLIGELQKFEAVSVVAVADVDDNRARQAQRRASKANVYASHRELLERQPDVQAVFVATPTHAHKDVVIDALSAGKHVYCEAPLAASAEDLRAIAAAAKNGKTVFQAGHQMRSNPVYKLARSFLRAGAVQDLVSLRTVFRRKTDWGATTPWIVDDPARGGLCLEVGAHQIDTACWFINRLPEGVSGSGSNALYQEAWKVPDTVHCMLRFKGGLRLSGEITLANSHEGRYEEFVGTMGSIKVAETHGWMFKEADAPTQGWEVYASRQKFHNEEGITLIADATKLAKAGKDLSQGIGLPDPPLFYAIEDFLKSVLEGKEVQCTAADGLRAAMIALAWNEAVISGREVAIDPGTFEGS